MNLHQARLPALLPALAAAASVWLVAFSGWAQQPAAPGPAALVGPICPDQKSVAVSHASPGAALVLRINGKDNSHASAGSGELTIDVGAPARLSAGDTVQVAQESAGATTLSNTIVVGCTDVLTYHNDSRRNGWNQTENTLTAANVTANSFGLVVQVGPDVLDEQIDAQPLVVTQQNVENFGTRNVVYVVTAANSVYALDAWSGQKLVSVNLGKGVPNPQGCDNNSATVGITGTPVIDRQTQTLYLISYTLEAGQPAYKLHALGLSNLAEKPGSPKVIAAAQKLGNQTEFAFDAAFQRQRAALLLSNGNIYAGFASFCDFKAGNSRGWVLGWNAATLAPLNASELTNRRTDTLTAICTYPGNQPCYLSSVWMSGYGLSADAAGNIFFSTGNTAPGTYDGVLNIGESIVKFAPNLAMLDLFTPSNVNILDKNDTDLGSGGVMVLPDLSAQSVPHLAVAAGKDGRLFILNRDRLGGFHTPDIPHNVPIDHCLCGPAFFEGADGKPRVVTSGGQTLRTWTLDTSKSPELAIDGSGTIKKSAQAGGFFTSISSNGKQPGSAIIWAVGRVTKGPDGKIDKRLTLYAFNARASNNQLPLLWSDVAGNWQSLDNSSDVVPTVANGMVYVASYRQLSIFGLKRPQPPAVAAEAHALVAAAAPVPEPVSGPTYWGTVAKVEGTRLQLTLRTGKTLEVDVAPAIKAGHARIVGAGSAARVSGKMGPDGVFEADYMWRVYDPAMWGQDRPQ